MLADLVLLRGSGPGYFPSNVCKWFQGGAIVVNLISQVILIDTSSINIQINVFRISRRLLAEKKISLKYHESGCT